MLDQSFSARTLVQLLQGSDVIRFKPWPTDADAGARTAVLTEIASRISAPDFSFPQFREKSRAGKVIYSARDITSLLALRKTHHNLLRLYGVRQSDRNALIHQVKELLQDSCAYTVLRLDIADFYDSVSRVWLMGKLDDDSILSYTCRELLRRLFASPQFATGVGLPRGLAVSATLSELYMRSMDRAMRALPDVYFYGRYVDDIIILSCSPASTVGDLANAAARDLGLRLNPSKCESTECSGTKNRGCIDRSGFDFLGYRFSMPKHPSDCREWRPVEIGTQRRRLARLSFRDGFIKRRYHGFSRDDLAEVGECWLYERN
jgi:hypothetical protein